MNFNLLLIQQELQVGVRQTSTSQALVAPVTGQNNKALLRSEIKPGIREVVLCKDGEGKLGVRVRHVNNVRMGAGFFFLISITLGLPKIMVTAFY